MNERSFRAEVEAETSSYLEALVAIERGERHSAVDFAARYRLLCRRLAIARSRGYGADLVEWLNMLALRGHAQLYRAAPARWATGDLLETLWRFPRAVRAEWRSQLSALLVFLVPAAGVFVALQLEPGIVRYLIDTAQRQGLEAMYDPGSERFLNPREAGSDLEMFGFYIYNNIGIAFRAFASGLLFGAGSVFFTAYNGLFLGAAAGHLTHIGSGSTFYPFVIGHGAFELTAIVMAGGAGLKVGYALLAPGPFARLVALERAARACLPIVYGFIAMLLLAAFLEAFWSSRHELGATVRYIVGGVLWAGVLAFVLLGGRRHAS